MSITRSSLLLDLREDQGSPRWVEFVERYRPLIAHSARKTGARSQDIDDIVQTVLLQLVRALPTFSYQREKGFFRAWLRRVTRNLTVDLQRKRSAMTNSPVAVELPEENTSDTADDEFERALLEAAMQSCQSAFRPRSWQCFVLHIVEQRPACEVAGELGLSENAVFINSSRVLAKLREFCLFHGEELQDGHFAHSR